MPTTPFDRGGFLRVAADSTTVVLDFTELSMLLDGIDVQRVRRPALWEPHRPTP